MKLTYLDILEQVFHDKWKGYDKKEVDTFLHLVAEDFKELHEELSQLRGKVERQEKKIAKLESANGNGDAKNLSPEALRDKARRVIQLARQEADKHLTEVDRELTRIKEEVQALRREKKELLNVVKGGRRALSQQQELAGANTPAVMNLPTVLRDGGIQFGIRVQPRSSRNEISGIQGDRLKIKLTSPPVDGAANKSCLKFLSKYFGVSLSRVTLVSGQSGRNKTIHIEGLDAAQFDSLLAPILSSNSNSK